MLEKFYQPQSGKIYLDGIDIKKLDSSWYRSQIGFVSQEPTLFACSIKENILFGCSSPVNEDKIIEAAKKANAHEFIADFPEGYNTIVGERGVKLSGGF